MYYTTDFISNIMGVKELPDYLYHYTSIEVLEKILKNSTLRFSRLDQVNDPMEVKASDIKKAETTIFISCWTDQTEEITTLWERYTKGEFGVRIKMPINMFEGRRCPDYHEIGGAINYLKYKSYSFQRRGYESS